MKTSIILLLVIDSFFSFYRTEAENTLVFFNRHKEIKEMLSKYLTEEETTMAMAIVAPEVSQYTYWGDYAQQKSMFMTYIITGKVDFSIGFFQMKPSFIEILERNIQKDDSLLLVFDSLLYKDDEPKDEIFPRKQRHHRLVQLSSLKGQSQYLAAFVLIAKKKTENIHFASNNDRLRYWATLYNAGINKSETEIFAMQSRKRFPRFGKKFNYADVVQEFYERLK